MVDHTWTLLSFISNICGVVRKIILDYICRYACMYIFVVIAESLLSVMLFLVWFEKKALHASELHIFGSNHHSSLSPWRFLLLLSLYNFDLLVVVVVNGFDTKEVEWAAFLWLWLWLCPYIIVTSKAHKNYLAVL